MKRIALFTLLAMTLTSGALVAAPPTHHENMGQPTGTPREMVATYESLADGILALKKAEWDMVHSILAVTYSHAMATLQSAMAKIEAGQGAKAEIETLAGFVSQLGNEGDAAVAAVRKRLLEGGHHHNAKGEEQGIYDPGFVIVTKTAKKALLDRAAEIGKMAMTKDAAALKAAWEKASSEFMSLAAGAGH
jgi:hypothetical protein